ncbi:MAG: hypothetical protein AAGK03_19145 [Pseudomonadota bacterium]
MRVISIGFGFLVSRAFTPDIGVPFMKAALSCGRAEFCHDPATPCRVLKKSLWITRFRCSHSLTKEIAIKAILGEAAGWTKYHSSRMQAIWPSMKSFSNREN